jgi:branched-chain amino acid transport system ATP-binding protein
MDVVFGISERVTVLHQGRIIAEGKPEDIKKNEEVHMVYLGQSEAL